MADDGNVKVFCRVRPPNEREGGATAFTKKCVAVPSADPLQQTVLLQLKGMAAQAAPKMFTFDRVFHELSSQREVFELVGVPITKACLEGYNGTIFAYGQTGSGKTFTMQGPDDVIDVDARILSERELGLRGLVPRVFDYLFQDAHTAGPLRVPTDATRVEHTFACSFMEIYNERVYDLLDHGSTRDAAGLTLRENGRKGVSVEGLIESVVTNAKQAAELMAVGARNRRVGQTAMNRESSRSHSVFVLQIQSKETTAEGITRTRLSRFNLVDLAGSERQKNTEAAGERLKEAGSINKSLSALGNVIMGLVEQSAGKNRHVHYRDSKLTFLLKDSLGGNSKTFMIATVSPAEDSSHETLSTLKFAQRAKMIRNNAVINEDTSGSVLVLQEEIVRLRRQLQEAQHGRNVGSDLVGDARLASVHYQHALTMEGASGSDAFSTGMNERLDELEDSLAFALEKNESLMRTNGQLSLQSSHMQALCSELKRNVSSLKLRLRLRNGHEGGDITEYESSADAIEWRMKYEELEEAFVELQDRLRTTRNSDADDSGGEVQKLNHMYLTLTKQLAHVIREKHDISRRLENKPLSHSDEEEKLSLLEAELVHRSVEFESKLNSVLAVNAAAEAKAEAASLELLHSKQKEAAWKIDQQQSQVVIARLEGMVKQLEADARAAKATIVDEQQLRIELEMSLKQEHAQIVQDLENQLAEKMTQSFELARAHEQLQLNQQRITEEHEAVKTNLNTREHELEASKRELKTALSSLDARVQEFESLSAEYDAYRIDQEARHQEFEVTLSGARASILELQSNKESMQEVITCLGEEKAQLQQTVLLLEEQIRSKETENTGLLTVQHSNTTQIEELTSECAKLKCDAADYCKLADEKSVKIEELLSDVASWNERYNVLSTVHEEVKTQLLCTQERVRELELRESELRDEGSTLRTSISTLEKSRDNLSSQLAVKQDELRQVEQANTDISTTLDDTRRSLENEQKRRRMTEMDLAATSESLLQANADKQNFAATVEDLERDAAELKERIADLQAQLAKSSDLLKITEEALRDSKEEIAQRAEDYSNQIANLKSDCADLVGQREKAIADSTEALSALQQEHQLEIEGLNRLAERVDGEHQAQVAQLSATIQDTETQLVAAIQEHNDQVGALQLEVKTLETSLLTEKQLRSKDNEAARQQLHDLTLKHEEEVTSLTAAASKQKNEDDATISALTRTVQSRSDTINEREVTIAELGAKISSLEDGLNRAQSTIGELRQTLQSTEVLRDELMSRSEALEKDLIAERAKRCASENEVRTLTDDLATQTETTRERENTITAGLKRIDVLEGQLDQMTKNSEKLSADLDQARKLYDITIRGHKRTVSNQQETHTAEVERLSSEAAANIDKLEKTLVTASEEIKAKIEEIERLEDTVKVHLSTILRVEKAFASEHEQKALTLTELAQAKAQLHDCELTIREKNDQIERANQQIETTQEEAEEERVRLSGRIQLLEADLKDLNRAHEVLVSSHSTLTKLHEDTVADKMRTDEANAEYLRRNDDLIRQVEDLKIHISTLSATIKQLEADICAQTKETEAWKQRKEEADAVVADLKRLVAQRDDELDDKDSVISGMEETIENLEADKLQGSNELQKIEEALQNSKNVHLSAMELLEKTKTELSDTQRKLLAADNENRAVIEKHSAAQGRLQEQVASIANELESAKERLATTMSELHDCKLALDASRTETETSLKKANEVEKELATQLASWEESKLALNGTIGELQQLADEQRLSAAEHKKEAEEAMRGLQSDLTLLRQELDHSTEKVSRQRKRNETLVESNAQLSDDIEKMKIAETGRKELIADLERKLLESHDRQSRTDSELDQTKLDLSATKSELAELETKYNALSDKFESEKEDLRRKQAHWEAKDKELQGRMSVVGEMEVQIADESKKVTDEKVLVAQKKKEAEKVKREYEQLKTRVEELETLKIQLSKEKEKFRREVNTLTQKLDQISKENDKLVGHDNKRQKIQHHIKVKEENNRLQSEVRLLTEEKHKLEVRIERLELSLKEKENIVNDAQRDTPRSPSSFKTTESEAVESSARKRLRSRIDL